MADYSCTSCEELRVDAPNFYVNGLGDEECESLQENTGLNPDSGNDDFTDLSNMDDCLIGNMEYEIDAYDSCKWKPFMLNLIPNLWTMFKGIICTLKGLWTLIEALQDRDSELCALITQVLSPQLGRYGIRPRADDGQANTLGTIVSKNGSPLAIDAEKTSHGADTYTGVGIRYARQEITDCEDSETTNVYETILPLFWGYKLASHVSIGDVIWYASKTDVQEACEWSDDLWQKFTDESWTWTQFPITSGSAKHKTVYFKLKCGNTKAGISSDYLCLTFEGTSYPNAAPGYNAPITEPSNEARTYKVGSGGGGGDESE